MEAQRTTSGIGLLGHQRLIRRCPQCVAAVSINFWRLLVGVQLVKMKGISQLVVFGDKLLHCFGLASLSLSLVQFCGVYCLSMGIVLLSNFALQTAGQVQRHHGSYISSSSERETRKPGAAASNSSGVAIAGEKTCQTVPSRAIWLAVVGQVLVSLNRILIALFLRRLPFLDFALPNYSEPSRKVSRAGRDGRE
eukprot:750596-Hanusia_phi.AAC.2